MACACSKKRKREQYLWYSRENPEGVKPVVYNSDIEAKAKVLRKGGAFIVYNANESIGAQIAIAEAKR